MILKDKVAVITGASSGIGLAIVEKFIKEGAKVVLSDLNEKAGQAVATRLGTASIFVRTDVADSAQVDDLVATAVKKFGKIDIMVNNAGIGGDAGGVLEYTDEGWRKLMSINLDGVFYGMRAAARAMKEAGTKGSIINMSSILGLVGMPGAIAYTSAKGGVSNMTRAGSLDLAPFGIRVNAISPGFIETNMTKDILANDQFQQFVKTNTPLGYAGKPEDIANVAALLASDDAGYVTGVVMPVDGGWTAR